MMATWIQISVQEAPVGKGVISGGEGCFTLTGRGYICLKTYSLERANTSCFTHKTNFTKYFTKYFHLFKQNRIK